MNIIDKIELEIESLEKQCLVDSCAKAEGMETVLVELKKYYNAFEILDEHFDCIHDEDKHDVHEKLKETGIYD